MDRLFDSFIAKVNLHVRSEEGRRDMAQGRLVPQLVALLHVDGVNAEKMVEPLCAIRDGIGRDPAGFHEAQGVAHVLSFLKTHTRDKPSREWPFDVVLVGLQVLATAHRARMTSAGAATEETPHALADLHAVGRILERGLDDRDTSVTVAEWLVAQSMAHSEAALDPTGLARTGAVDQDRLIGAEQLAATLVQFFTSVLLSFRRDDVRIASPTSEWLVHMRDATYVWSPQDTCVARALTAMLDLTSHSRSHRTLVLWSMPRLLEALAFAYSIDHAHVGAQAHELMVRMCKADTSVDHDAVRAAVLKLEHEDGVFVALGDGIVEQLERGHADLSSLSPIAACEPMWTRLSDHVGFVETVQRRIVTASVADMARTGQLSHLIELLIGCVTHTSCTRTHNSGASLLAVVECTLRHAAALPTETDDEQRPPRYRFSDASRLLARAVVLLARAMSVFLTSGMWHWGDAWVPRVRCVLGAYAVAPDVALLEFALRDAADRAAAEAFRLLTLHAGKAFVLHALRSIVPIECLHTPFLPLLHADVYQLVTHHLEEAVVPILEEAPDSTLRYAVELAQHYADATDDGATGAWRDKCQAWRDALEAHPQAHFAVEVPLPTCPVRLEAFRYPLLMDDGRTYELDTVLELEYAAWRDHTGVTRSPITRRAWTVPSSSALRNLEVTAMIAAQMRFVRQLVEATPRAEAAVLPGPSTAKASSTNAVSGATEDVVATSCDASSPTEEDAEAMRLLRATAYRRRRRLTGASHALDAAAASAGPYELQ